jgi:hypothetical protein
MQKKRVFRQDYNSLSKEYNFKRGEVATIVKENDPDVTFKIDKKAYSFPYRDFIIITKRLDAI